MYQIEKTGRIYKLRGTASFEYFCAYTKSRYTVIILVADDICHIQVVIIEYLVIVSKIAVWRH